MAQSATALSVELRDTSDTANPWVPASVIRLRSDRNTGVVATSSTSQYDLRVLVDTNNLATGAAYTATSTVWFTNSYIMENDGAGIAPKLFDNGEFGDETCRATACTPSCCPSTSRASGCLPSWSSAGLDAASQMGRGRSPASTLLAAGPDPLGRADNTDAQSRFKIRLSTTAASTSSLDGITVQYKRPGEDTWNDITNFPDHRAVRR